MKATELKQMLLILGTMIRTRATVPILEYILLWDEHLITSCITSTITIPVPGWKGKTLFPAAKLNKIIASLSASDDVVLLDLGKLSCGIEINGKVKFKFNELWEPEDFPKVPPVEGQSVLINAKDMATIHQAWIFASDDELRPALTGVFIDDTHIVSTDGNRLFFKEHSMAFSGELPKADNSANPGFTIDPSAQKALSKLKGDVRLIQNGTNVVFSDDNGCELTTRMVDDRFPDNYINVIPDKDLRVCKALVNRHTLSLLLKQALIVAQAQTHQVSIITKKNILTVSAKNLDTAEEFTDEMEAMIDGEPIDLDCNAKFLLEIIDNCGPAILIECQEGGNKVIMIDNEYLLMPVMREER